MVMRPLGRTGMMVAPVGLGCWGIGGVRGAGPYGHLSLAEARKSLALALELGCTLFDTADSYGEGASEELLGEVLAARREQVLICTKGGVRSKAHGLPKAFAPAYLEEALSGSLRRLQTGYIDIYLLHGPQVGDLRPELFEWLQKQKESGRIRAWGISLHGTDEILHALAQNPPDVVELPVHLFHLAFAEELLPELAARKIGVIAREPLASGLLTGKYGPDATFPPGDVRHRWPRLTVETWAEAVQVLKQLIRPDRTLAQLALQFVLSLSGISCVIPGAKSPAQVRENLMAAAGPPLEGNDWAVIKKVCGPIAPALIDRNVGT